VLVLVLDEDEAVDVEVDEDEDEEDDSLGVDRESVMYQPEPLKTIPTGCSTFCSGPPQASWVVRGASEKVCFTSKRLLQDLQAYS
jgi:hypothetical protein